MAGRTVTIAAMPSPRPSVGGTSVTAPQQVSSNRSVQSAARSARTAGPAAIAGGAWLALYAAVSFTGHRLTTDYLTYGWQLVPYDELRAHPFSSVWDLHIQPPLWNLAVGIIGRWSPLTDALSIQLLMAAMGALGAALLADALVCAGTPPRGAVPLAVASMAIPDVLFNAFGATYELPVATGLIAVVWIVCRGARSAHRGRWLVALAVVATSVTMTRTVYHPLWLVILLGGVGWWWRRSLQWRTLLTAAAIPLLVVGGWMVKNEVLVGRFTLSTWSGMNLQRAVIPVLPAAEKARMLADGELSGVAEAGPFHRYDDYVPAVGACVPRSGDSPVLTRLDRGGRVYVPNFNARCFLKVFDLAGDDALTVIRTHPGVYADGRLWAVRTWFALYDGPKRSPSALFRGLYHVYDVALVGAHGTLSMTNWGTPIYGPVDELAHFSLVLVACTVACMAAAVTGLGRRRRGTDGAWIDAVVGFLVAWTLAVGVLLELGEQARFRTMIDPLTLSFGLVAIWRGARALLARRRRSATVPDAQHPTPVGR